MNKQATALQSASSRPLLTIAGIDIFIHWSFLILLAFIAVSNWMKTGSITQVLWSLAFIGVLFVCVVLHELGHSLAARRFGIQTRSITLLPIGGVASLEKIPEEPKQEVIVALAGPMVNVVIGAILIGILSFQGGLQNMTSEALSEINAQNFLLLLLMVNVMLVVFNMLPAFPMDGGRVFRAALSFFMDRVKATRIAAGMGKLLALGFIILGLFHNPFLILIGVFVIFGAHTEYEYTKSKSLLQGLSTGMIMMRNFTPLHPDQTVNEAVATLLNGQESKFLVMDGPVLKGIISKNDIIQALGSLGKEAPLRVVMTSNPLSISVDRPMQEAYELMMQNKISALPVMSGTEVKGLLDMDNILEALMILQAGKQFSEK
jgi:Zn-dependent protease/CBS domain-containing protein